MVMTSLKTQIGALLAKPARFLGLDLDKGLGAVSQLSMSCFRTSNFGTYMWTKLLCVGVTVFINAGVFRSPVPTRSRGCGSRGAKRSSRSIL